MKIQCPNCDGYSEFPDELHYQYVVCRLCGIQFQALTEKTVEVCRTFLDEVLAGDDARPESRLVYEQARLEALRQFEILDTPPEETFDDIIDLASQACGTRMAAITLLDSDRQWFKASIGLDFRETPRELAFCNLPVDTGRDLVVEDALDDARFRDNPLVVGPPHLRFYAGAPLIAPNGTTLGTVCVPDTQPRKLTPQALRTLSALARVTMRLIEGRRNSRHLAEVLRRSSREN